MRAPLSAMKPIGWIVFSGDPCPESGSWTVIDHPKVAASISAGQIMPNYLGKKVGWRLAHYGI
jgi:hypothetical protein